MRASGMTWWTRTNESAMPNTMPSAKIPITASWPRIGRGDASSAIVAPDIEKRVEDDVTRAVARSAEDHRFERGRRLRAGRGRPLTRHDPGGGDHRERGRRRKPRERPGRELAERGDPARAA